MNRNIMFSAAVVLVVLSLFLPWFTLTFSSERTTKDNFYADGKKVTIESDASVKYYLDKTSVSQRTDETKSGKTESTYFGGYDHTRENLESGGTVDNTESFLYSIYKIVMVILILSFTVLVLESFGNESSLDSMKTGIALLHVIILLLFITGIKNSYLEDTGDGVILSSPNSNEYVNMTMPVGFNSLVSNDTHTQYYGLEDFGFEKTVVDVAPYDWTSTGNYFVLFSGPVSDEVEWDRNNYNTTFSYDNQTAYYVWFDKQEMDANVSDRDPTPDEDDCSSGYKACKGIRVEITDLSESEDSAYAIRNRIIQTFSANSAPFGTTGNATDSDRMYFESTYYGNNQDSGAWSYSGSVFTEVNGFATFEAVTSDTTLTANWYPSTGFVASLIGFVCFVASRFED
jgi:hypothetical protein